jgi:hypothetical protein
MKRLLWILSALIVAAPGLNQLRLLATAISGRISYPYDLEWMEGGMLHHALRIQNGQGIYVAPSIDFIPYLYTPLYPGLLALFGRVFGLSYLLGRTLSVLALLGCAAIAMLSICARRHQLHRDATAWAGVALGLGGFAAAYPYCEGWYDLVRADTVFLFLVTAGIAGLARWSVNGEGWRGHARVAAGATVLVLAFFAKQTGFVYVGFGGFVVLVLNWRRAFTYGAVAAVLALGLIALFQVNSDGWFWEYVSKIHRAHDFSWTRFHDSFRMILGHFWMFTGVIAVGLVAVVVTRVKTGVLPPQAKPFLLWTATYAMSTVVGAIGFGTEWAVFNAFMPAFLHGGLAAGAALPAVAACARLWNPRLAELSGGLAALVLATPLCVQLVRATWDPHKYMPTSADVAAGDKLIAQLHDLPGDLWAPSHPWYAVMAGKLPHVHRMGVKDVTRRQQRDLTPLANAIKAHEFSAILFDNIDLDSDTQEELVTIHNAIDLSYRRATKLGKSEQPRLYNGAKVVPAEIWVPSLPAVTPPGAHAIADFEVPLWGDRWTSSGAAWGPSSVMEVPNVPVYGITGQRYASSDLSGDVATGRLTSAEFPLDGASLTMMLGGGTDATKLRVELWVDNVIAKTASVPLPGGDTLQRVTLELGDDLRGKQAKLVLVDDSPTGHLEVDDIWLWQTAQQP